ncbi:glycosyltransferase family 2 protein [Dyella sp. C9]|uniref:glycosyltransferase family 2 protein n=1 Tax=Dyella sp. C9 TaxID=2202154 RepID=UPI000DEFD991|nr:glycosyltransferase family 2 protein [Dyella sp. C9]
MMAAGYLVFWLCALLLAHIFVGYPLCVWLQARLFPRAIAKQPCTPTVTVVIAAYEGAAHIEAKLVSLGALQYPRELVDILVACDGCTDDTARRALQFGDERVRVLEYPSRRGKAACLNDAVRHARGEVLLMTDLRQRLAPGALQELVANLADPSVGAVGGELMLSDPETGFAQSVDAYWRYEKLIRHAESRSGSTIGVSGALYAIRRSLFQPLPDGTVLDDVLVPMRVIASGHRVVFEPAAVAWDRVTQAPTEERRRKIRTLAGNCQLIQLAPWLLLPWRNPAWFRFVSHKLLRLLGPWLLVGLAISSACLASSSLVCAATLALLLLASLLVVVGRLQPAPVRWLPVRLAVAFFYLNLFAAQAVVTFARNRGLHLW